MTTIQLPKPTTDRLDLVDADEYDFYREIHKGIRYALFTTTIAAGRLDVAADDGVEALLDAHQNVLHLLHTHHEHEDSFIQPLVEAHAPALALEVLDQHRDIEAGMVRLELLADRLATVGAPGRRGAAVNLHLDLSRLTSAYLAHQLVEETRVMPALRAVVPTEELLALDMEIRGSIPPEEMVLAMTHMLPAMTVEERADMLGGMAMAPPPVFAVFRQAAQMILSSDDFDEVARRAGIA
jgi:hypothetical protein